MAAVFRGSESRDSVAIRGETKSFDVTGLSTLPPSGAANPNTSTSQEEAHRSFHELRKFGEHRTEPRFELILPVFTWGFTAEGLQFGQEARVLNFSERGALLVRIEHKLRCGDLIGMKYEGRQARFRVIWTQETEAKGQYRVAVQRIESDICPWAEVLARL